MKPEIRTEHVLFKIDREVKTDFQANTESLALLGIQIVGMVVFAVGTVLIDDHFKKKNAKKHSS